MTQSLKIECLVTDLTLEGEVASFLVTKEQLTAGLNKKADLVDGKIKESNLPDFIANGFQTVNQKLSTLETSITDGIQSAKDYAEAYTDEKLIQKADLVDGKVPASQLPSISEYSGLSEALTSVLDQARRDMIERTDEIQRVKADLGEDGKVVREQLPNYAKIPGLETVVTDLYDSKANADDVETSFKESQEQLDAHSLLLQSLGSILPYNPSNTYAEGYVTLKDGSLQQLVSGGWVPFKINSINAVDASGESQQQVNYNGGSKWHYRDGGYQENERVVLDNGDIVKSTVDENANDPNVNMTGWVKIDDVTQLRYKLKPNLLGSNIANKLAESVSVKDFGAIGDGTVHTIQEWVAAGKFSNLTAIQVVYPHATALTDTVDWVACQAAIDFVGKGGPVLFNQTASNTYIINKPLKYYNGQHWVGCGGIDVSGLGTEIRLSASATSVAEPKIPSSVTYGFNPVGIYFNALSYAPAALWLYNTSYSNIDQCAANCASANGGAFLFDSDTSKQCYFNKLNIPRAFASGIGGAAFKFVRGANANQIFGGKAGGSYRGAEFTSLSSGNLIIGTDFEENTDCHVYVDTPNNVFIGTHMESAPIGFNITALGSNTQRMNTTYATTTVVNVQDASRVGTVLDTRMESSQTTGDLRFGGAKFKSTFLSASTNLDYDPDLISGSSNTGFRMFLNTNTTGLRHLTLYKGNGTSTESIRLNAGTGEILHGDILQASSTNIVRKMIRSAAIPATGDWSTGDKVLRTNPNTTNSVVTEWTCVTAGTSGTWAATGWYTKKDTKANRPTGLTSSDAGVQFFDTTLAAAGKPIWWTGSAWVDATGAIV